MLPQHGLSDIEKNGQDMIRLFTLSPTTYPCIGQYDDSIAAHTGRVDFKFAQIGLGDVDIAMNKRDALSPFDWYLFVDAMPQRV